MIPISRQLHGRIRSLETDNADLQSELRGTISFVHEDVKELIGGLAEEMRRGFAKVDEEMRRGFAQVDARFEHVESRLDAKIDEKFEESKRHFGVVADLRSQIQTVAESVGVLDRKIDRVDERLSG